LIAFKAGVNIRNVHPAIWIAIGMAESIRAACYSDTPMVITALADTSGHNKGSYHYAAATPSKMCQAVDIRDDDLTPAQRDEWTTMLQAKLRPLGYDIVIEHVGSTVATTGDHIHIEYQPKTQGSNYFGSLLKA
jgi:hypothetical protein